MLSNLLYRVSLFLLAGSMWAADYSEAHELPELKKKPVSYKVFFKAGFSIEHKHKEIAFLYALESTNLSDKVFFYDEEENMLQSENHSFDDQECIHDESSAIESWSFSAKCKEIESKLDSERKIKVKSFSASYDGDDEEFIIVTFYADSAREDNKGQVIIDASEFTQERVNVWKYFFDLNQIEDSLLENVIREKNPNPKKNINSQDCVIM